MQTMPAKTRTAVTVGAVLLAVAVGIFALWSGNREAEQTPTEVNPAALLPPVTDPVVPDPATAGPLIGESSDPEIAPMTPVETQPDIELTVPTSNFPSVHVVMAGDTLFEISRAYYGTHIYAGDIERLNNLGNPNHLLVGTELQLPSPDSLTDAR